jgi:hypothetical protein
VTFPVRGQRDRLLIGYGLPQVERGQALQLRNEPKKSGWGFLSDLETQGCLADEPRIKGPRWTWLRKVLVQLNPPDFFWTSQGPRRGANTEWIPGSRGSFALILSIYGCKPILMTISIV